jgi:hypothetical protein
MHAGTISGNPSRQPSGARCPSFTLSGGEVYAAFYYIEERIPGAHRSSRSAWTPR